MSVRQRTSDPTQTQYMREEWSNRAALSINQILGSLIALDSLEMLLMLVDDALDRFQTFFVESAGHYIDLSLDRGFIHAATEINLNPDYDAGAGHLPADEELRRQCLEEATKDIDGLTDSLRHQVADAIEVGTEAGAPLDEIKDTISDALTIGKARVAAIAHTTIIKAYNEAARRRYVAFGVKKYRFWSSLDPKVCDQPKRLRDGSVAERGCEGMHGTEWNVDDTAHCPPIHPICRCCILPIVE